MSDGPPSESGSERSETASPPPDDHPTADQAARPPETNPGDEDPTTERIAWVLVALVAIVLLVPLPAAVPEGTVAALLTALTTILINRHASG